VASAAAPDGAAGPSAVRRLGAFGLGLLVTGVLVAATVGAALTWRARIEDDERRTFLSTAAQVERRLGADLERIDATTVAVAEQTLGPRPLTAESFAGPVLEAVPVEVPASVVTLAVVEPVAADDVEAFVGERRDDGLVDFQVREPGEGELAVATFEQSGGAQPFFDGLDLGALPAARAALDEASATGEPVTSSVLGRLPSGEGSLLRSGFLVVVPVVADGVTPGGEGGAEVERWVVALVDGEQLLDLAVAGAEPGTDAQLVLAGPDAADGAGRSDLLASTARDGETAIDLASADAAWQEQASLGGDQDLQLTVAQLEAQGSDRDVTEPTAILLVGTFASVLLGALVWALARTRASALALAASATDTLRHSEEQFRTVVQNLSDIVLLLDEAGTIRYASPSVRALLGWPPKDTVGSSIFDGMHPDDEPMVREAMVDAGLRDPGRPVSSRPLLDVRMRHADSRFRMFEATVSDVVDADVGGLVFTAHDVSHRVATEERLAHDATHDPLTHLPNRTLLDDRLAHALDRSRRTGAQVAVLFLDLDGFKEVNDSWGHAAGDQVLTEVAGRVAATARSSDTVARIGGDEFVVVCEDAGTVSGAQTLAGRILEVVGTPITVAGITHHVGASVGIAVARPEDGDAAELIRRADAAMYRAKQAGRGRIELDRPAVSTAEASPVSTGEASPVSTGEASPVSTGEAASPPPATT
jgi:diguanylate cyclase (GGDEF)-like protein/PAS domain S-box-containing protein